ncbi:Dual specificity phosphatase, partial [Thalictrum thalictroides]
HGRSVAVVCALLVALGVAENWKNAEEIIRGRRPCIRMNSLHRKHLEEWSKNRLAPIKNEEMGVSSVILSEASENLRQKRSHSKSENKTAFTIPCFASISSDDIAFLDQLLNSAEEGDQEVLDFGSEHDPDEEETLDERRFENVIQLSQILFSAMIEEDGIEESNFDDEKNDGTSAIVHDPSGESIYASEEPYDGDILKSETGKTAMVPSQGCSDISLDDSQYQNMSFEERSSVELESVGIYYKEQL